MFKKTININIIYANWIHIYSKTLLEELLNDKINIELNMDSQSAIALIKNDIINKRSKHIDVKFRFVHELFKDKVISLKYYPMTE